MINKEKLNGCNEYVLALAGVLESYIQKQGFDIIITSGKRSPAENAAAGGAPDSDHLRGDAFDFYFTDPYIIFRHVTPLYNEILSKTGFFARVSKMEVVRGVIGGKWVNHMHLSAVEQPGAPVYFTGVYQ
jgi:hypothetical protein